MSSIFFCWNIQISFTLNTTRRVNISQTMSIIWILLITHITIQINQSRNEKFFFYQGWSSAHQGRRSGWQLIPNVWKILVLFPVSTFSTQFMLFEEQVLKQSSPWFPIKYFKLKMDWKSVRIKKSLRIFERKIIEWATTKLFVPKSKNQRHSTPTNQQKQKIQKTNQQLKQINKNNKSKNSTAITILDRSFLSRECNSLAEGD